MQPMLPQKIKKHGLCLLTVHPVKAPCVHTPTLRDSPEHLPVIPERLHRSGAHVEGDSLRSAHLIDHHAHDTLHPAVSSEPHEFGMEGVIRSGPGVAVFSSKGLIHQIDAPREFRKLLWAIPVARRLFGSKAL
jgi:hypothetical protein